VTAAESWGTLNPIRGKLKIFNSALRILGEVKLGFFADSEKIARLYLAIKPLLDWKMATATFLCRLQSFFFCVKTERLLHSIIVRVL
jgi:hypothetical protein